MSDYIINKQRRWQEERQREADEEAKREAEREAELAAEALKRKEAAERKKLLQEQQEAERLRQKRLQEKKELDAERMSKQVDTIISKLQADQRLQENVRLQEVKIIIQNREPTLQVLDWRTWLSIPYNQRLAELDFEYAVQVFKHDNLMANRRKGTGGKKRPEINYVLSFSGDTAADATENYVETTFNPDSYDGEGTGLNRGFTVSYWVKPLEVTGDVFFAFGKRSQRDGRFEFGIKNKNKIKVGIGGASKDDNDESDLFEVGTWYNFVVTYGGTWTFGDAQVRVYLNGTELLKSGASGGGMGTAAWVPGKQNCDEGCDDPVNAASYLYFGGRSAFQDLDSPYNQGWACSLSEVAIYNVEKDEDGTFANEVYNAGWDYNHEGNSGLVGYWKFNEGSGTTVKDYGPYGKHGTFGAISGDTTAYPSWEQINK
jgi:hypothetical protein